MNNVTRLATGLLTVVGIFSFSNAFGAIALSDVTWNEGVANSTETFLGNTNNDQPAPETVNQDSVFGFNDWAEVQDDTDVSGTSGEWSTTVNLAAYTDVMIVLKGGNGNGIDPSNYVAYRAPILTNESSGSDYYFSGTWDSPFEKNGPTDVSHYTIYARGQTSPVPIPAAAWLFGSALIGMVGVGARRKR